MNELDVAAITCDNAAWSEPFSIGLQQRPQIVMLADARNAGTLESVDIGAIDWRLDQASAGGKYRVRITRAATLQSGKSYDLKFLVVY